MIFSSLDDEYVMSIKSFFFPKEALQGQDLPSHVTWSDLKFDYIKILHSKNMKLKEIYNVADEDLEINEDNIIITNVEVNGYIGMVFSTSVLPERSYELEVECSFIVGNQVIQTVKSNTRLFRPDIVIKSVPNIIKVNPNSDEISNRILVRNFGEGTAMVDIETTSSSNIQKHSPKFLEVFLQDFFGGVKKSISELKQSYSEYSSLLDKLEFFLTNPIKIDEETLKELEKLDEAFNQALEENEAFIESLTDSLAEAFLRSKEFSNVYQFILDYINSIGKEKILIIDPFTVIDLNEEPETLTVKVKCVDMLKQICTEIVLPEINVLAREKCEVSLFKLFQWGESVTK